MLDKTLHKYKHALVFLAYAGLIAAVYSEVVFFNKSLLPWLCYPAGATGFHEDLKRRPVNVFNVDLGAATFEMSPVNRTAGHMYRALTLPLWNPYQGCGTPMAAQYSTRVFSPYQIMANLLPWQVWDYVLLGRMLIAGFFTYLFLVCLGLSSWASFLGGVLYMFSGSMTWFLNLEEFSNVAMCTPVVLYYLERMLTRGDSCSLAASSFAIALVVVAGQPEVAVYILLLAAAYYVFRAIALSKEKSRLIRTSLKGAAALLLGLGLAAFLIFPFLELYRVSYNCHPAGGPAGVEGAAPLGFAINLFMPIVSELPTYYRYFPHNGVWDYLGGYSGTVTIFLILCALFADKKNRHYASLLFFGVFGLLIILKNFGCPLVLWLGSLPLLDQSWSCRWAGGVWTFCLAAAAAIGAEILHQAKPRRSALVLIILAFLCISLSYYPLKQFWFRADVFDFQMGQDQGNFKKVLPYLSLGTTVMLAVLCMAAYLIWRHNKSKDFIFGTILLAVFELGFWIPRGLGSGWRSLEAIPLAIGMVSIAAFLQGRKKIAGFGIACSAIAAAAIHLYAPNGLPERGSSFLEKPYIRFLQEQKGQHRIMGIEGVMMPNFAGAFKLYDVRYIDALSPVIYQDYVDRYLRRTYHDPTDRLWFTGLCEDFEQKLGCGPAHREVAENLAFYSFLGVKYILSPSRASFDLPIVYEDAEVKVYGNPACQPRVFIARTIERASSYSEAQGLIGRPGFDFKNTVVLEEDAPAPGITPAADRSFAYIEDYRPDKVAVRASVEEPGILVLTDIYYPGWKAYIDGRPTRIYRVNGLVRGLFIEKGDHEVVFTYFPTSFKLGLGLAGLCGLVCIALFFNKRKPKPL